MDSKVYHNGISGIKSACHAKIHRKGNVTSVWIQYSLSSNTVPCCGSTTPRNTLFKKYSRCWYSSWTEWHLWHPLVLSYFISSALSSLSLPAPLFVA